MRLLRSEEEVPDGGASVPIATLAALARDWYGDRLEAAWRPRTLEQSQAILARHGLTGEFWRLG
jgi:hypothetical protein